MHPTDKIDRFIELRANGLSIPKISQLIDVPASTLYDWNDHERDRIQKRTRQLFEEVEERVLGSHYCQLESLASALKAVDKQIIEEVSESIEYEKLPQLIRIGESLRRRLNDLRRHAFEHLNNKPAAPPVELSLQPRQNRNFRDFSTC